METVNLFIHLLTCYLCYLNVSFTDVERSSHHWRETGWIIRTTRLWCTKEKAARWVWCDIPFDLAFSNFPVSTWLKDRKFKTIFPPSVWNCNLKLSHLHLRDHFSPPFLSACESKEINPVISRERLQSNFNQKFQISFCEMLKYKLYQLKVLPKRSRLNGHTAGFPPQTQKLTPSLGLGRKGSSGQVARKKKLQNLTLWFSTHF